MEILSCLGFSLVEWNHMWQYALTENSGYIAQENIYFLRDNQGTLGLVAFVFVNRTLQYLRDTLQ